MYKPLEKKDWKVLSALASEIASILISDMEAGVDPDRQPSFEEVNLYSKMHGQIEFMEMKYGPHPMILDTKADFVKEPDEQIRLKELAISLCRSDDYDLRGNITKELAELYADEKNEIERASKLIEKAISDLEKGNDPNDLAEAKEIRDKISNSK